MSLSEVNFYVVKALLNLYPIKETDGNVLTAFNQVFAQLNGVLKNYIRGPDAMRDCLQAIEVNLMQTIHLPFNLTISILFNVGKLSSKRNPQIENSTNYSFFV